VHDVPLAGLRAQLELEVLVGVGVLLGVLGEGALGGLLLREHRRLVLGRRDGGVGLLEGVDVERVVDDRVGLGIRRRVERLEQTREIGVLVVDHVDRDLLGRLLGGLGLGELVALLRLVVLGRLLGRGRELDVVEVVLGHVRILGSSSAAAARRRSVSRCRMVAGVSR